MLGLWKVKANFWAIRREFYDVFQKTNKYYFHDLDAWFEKNNYVLLLQSGRLSKTV
jgi:hypothetical protein